MFWSCALCSRSRSRVEPDAALRVVRVRRRELADTGMDGTLELSEERDSVTIVACRRFVPVPDPSGSCGSELDPKEEVGGIDMDGGGIMARGASVTDTEAVESTAGNEKGDVLGDITASFGFTLESCKSRALDCR